jgi:hypothetical protein
MTTSRWSSALPLLSSAHKHECRVALCLRLKLTLRLNRSVAFGLAQPFGLLADFADNVERRELWLNRAAHWDDMAVKVDKEKRRRRPPIAWLPFPDHARSARATPKEWCG